jgi:hypothetical protein
MFKIITFKFFGEPRKRFAVLVDGSAVELPHGMHPIRRIVAPYVAQLRDGTTGYMARVNPDGSWTAFESGRI